MSKALGLYALRYGIYIPTGYFIEAGALGLMPWFVFCG